MIKSTRCLVCTVVIKNNLVCIHNLSQKTLVFKGFLNFVAEDFLNGLKEAVEIGSMKIIRMIMLQSFREIIEFNNFDIDNITGHRLLNDFWKYRMKPLNKVNYFSKNIIKSLLLKVVYLERGRVYEFVKKKCLWKIYALFYENFWNRLKSIK